MIILLNIIFLVLSITFFIVGACSYKHETVFYVLGLIFTILYIIIFVFSCFNGFINYPKTEGEHIGIITAVDLEGIYFRRYEVYLKSGALTKRESGDTATYSDETKYLIYEEEKELAEQIKSMIGKKVKIKYGHDGGYIGWKSCGTYHIKNIELIEEE